MIGTDITIAADYLKKGNIVAIPTETVYGLAANALNQDAVLRIYTAKNRPTFNPLIVHIKSVNELGKYAIDIPENALLLAEKFWPGPLSLLLRKNEIIPDFVTAGSPYVVLRVPNQAQTLELLNSLDFPLAAPSANIYQSVSPTTAKHVASSLGNKVAYILNGGPSMVGIESTICGFQGESPVIHRLGAISVEDIEDFLSLKVLQADDSKKTPGSEKIHYSTKKRILLVDSIEEYRKNPEPLLTSYIYWNKSDSWMDHIGQWNMVYSFSKNNNLQEAAKNLYGILHEADADQSELIVIERVPNENIGYAINDRLMRASAKK